MQTGAAGVPRRLPPEPARQQQTCFAQHQATTTTIFTPTPKIKNFDAFGPKYSFSLTCSSDPLSLKSRFLLIDQINKVWSVFPEEKESWVRGEFSVGALSKL
jgi:hypothetical protein